MSKPIFILNGPSLNRLGTREPEIYGRLTLDDIRARCTARAAARGLAIDFRQSNREGELVEWIHEAIDGASALVINPAAYGHTSIALLDALRTLPIPIIECHLSNPAAREAFRAVSYVSLAATGVICGLGPASYDLAVEAACDLVLADRPAA